MALPVLVDPTSPANQDEASFGAEQIRDLKQLIVDLFGIPITPTQITKAVTAINGTSGEFAVIRPALRTITVSDTLTTSDATVICNSGSAINLTLLAASSCPGKFYFIRNINTGVVTLVGTIEGIASPTLNPGMEFYLYSDGTSYYGKKIALEGTEITANSVSSPVTLASMSVLAGARIAVTGIHKFTTGAATRDVSTVLSATGSATWKIGHALTGDTRLTHFANASGSAATSQIANTVIIEVTGSGSLVLSLAENVLTSTGYSLTALELHAMVLRKD